MRVRAHTRARVCVGMPMGVCSSLVIRMSSQSRAVAEYVQVIMRANYFVSDKIPDTKYTQRTHVTLQVVKSESTRNEGESLSPPHTPSSPLPSARHPSCHTTVGALILHHRPTSHASCKAHFKWYRRGPIGRIASSAWALGESGCLWPYTTRCPERSFFRGHFFVTATRHTDACRLQHDATHLPVAVDLVVQLHEVADQLRPARTPIFIWVIK